MLFLFPQRFHHMQPAKNKVMRDSKYEMIFLQSIMIKVEYQTVTLAVNKNSNSN
jgi:hypothetical protein